MYKYLKLMSRTEFKALMIHYGNNTGAEINNTVIRELFDATKNNVLHPALFKLNMMIENAGRNELINKISGFVKCTDDAFSDDELYLFIREERNRISMEQAIANNRMVFMGFCCKHGVTGFVIRNHQSHSTYNCQDCHELGGNNILYNPERNIILRSFLKNHDVNKKELSSNTGITPFLTPDFINMKSKIVGKKWQLLSEFIINKTGGSNAN